MAKTLTINVDDEHAARAEQLAARYGISVTEWVERLVRLATPAPARVRAEDLPPVTRSALGMLSNLPDRPYKELLAEAIWEKHGDEK